MFAHPASMHQGGDFETAGKIIDFVPNINGNL